MEFSMEIFINNFCYAVAMGNKFQLGDKASKKKASCPTNTFAKILKPYWYRHDFIGFQPYILQIGEGIAYIISKILLLECTIPKPLDKRMLQTSLG